MALRLRSDVQVSGLQRQAESEGLFFSVLHRGHEEGGLIFIKWVEGRSAKLFCEQTVGDERRWVCRTSEKIPEAELNQMLTSEQSFDPDLWVVEIMGRFEAAAGMLNPVED